MTQNLSERSQRYRLNIRRQQIKNILQQKRLANTDISQQEAKDIMRKCAKDMYRLVAQGTNQTLELLELLGKLCAVSNSYDVSQRLCQPEIQTDTQRNILPEWLKPRCSLIDLALFLINQNLQNQDILEQAITFLSLITKQLINESSTNSDQQLTHIAHHFPYSNLLSTNPSVSQACLCILQPLILPRSHPHPNLLHHVLSKTPTLTLLIQLSHRSHLTLSHYSRQYATTLTFLISLVSTLKLWSVNQNIKKLSQIACRTVLDQIVQCSQARNNSPDQKQEIMQNQKQSYKMFDVLYRSIPQKDVRYQVKQCQNLEQGLPGAIQQHEYGYLVCFKQAMHMWQHCIKLDTLSTIFKALLCTQGFSPMLPQLVQIIFYHVINQGVQFRQEQCLVIREIIEHQGGQTLVHLHRLLRQEKEVLAVWIRVLEKWLDSGYDQEQLIGGVLAGLLQEEEWSDMYIGASQKWASEL